MVDLEEVFGPLVDEPRWVGWRYKDRADLSSKLPIDPRTGAPAKTNDESTWGTLGEAQHAVREHALEGVGIVLGNGLGGVDLDACRYPETGELAPWAREVINEFATYAEVSPSGTGVKLFAVGAPENLPANTIPIDGQAIGEKNPAIEAYSSGRYFTVTGEILEGAPAEVCDAGDVGGAWDRIVQRLARRNKKRHGASLDESGSRVDEWLQALEKGSPLHDATLRLVARWVAKGLTDSEIRGFLEGYRPRIIETRGAGRADELFAGELDRMIRGARERGFDDPPPSAEAILEHCGIHDLGEDAAAEDIERVVRSIAAALRGADTVRRQVVRDTAVKALGRVGVKSPARVIDTALDAVVHDPDGSDRGEVGSRLWDEPPPWEHAVDGAELLDELVSVFERFMALPDGAASTLALWVLHAHAHDAAFISPLLAITSPEKRCGKTTLLQILGALVPRALHASNITPASLFRAVEAYRPTLLVDEADSFLREREELRGVLNSGHARPTAFVVRAVAVGDDYEPKAFSTWAPKAVALIDSGGTLPDTLRDRSMGVRLRRRAPGEQVERLRLDRLDRMTPTKRRCSRWAYDHSDELREADPAVPESLHDRARDNWRPLLAIADAAGVSWPERAREAALLLSAGRDEDEASARVLLLGDLRRLFDEKGKQELGSRTIVDHLAKMDERPWPEWKRGSPITTRQLAQLLGAYSISSTRIRVGGRQVRGYRRDAFVDEWERYLPQTTGVSDTSQPSQVGTPRGLPGSDTPVTTPDLVTESDPPAGSGTPASVTPVTDPQGEDEEVPR